MELTTPLSITTSPPNIRLHCSIVNPLCRSLLLTAKALKFKFDFRPIDRMYSGHFNPEFLESTLYFVGYFVSFRITSAKVNVVFASEDVDNVVDLFNGVSGLLACGIIKCNKSTITKMVTESTKVSPPCRSVLLTLSALNIGLNELPIVFIEHASDENTTVLSFTHTSPRLQTRDKLLVSSNRNKPLRPVDQYNRLTCGTLNGGFNSTRLVPGT
ncbi:hypothetical protein ACI65C_000020 [Semiaphis heraclei]